MSALSRRRALCSAAAVGSALALPAVAVNASNPDAELIGLCNLFKELERHNRSFFSNFCSYIEDDDDRGVATQAINDRQEGLIDRIEELGVHGLEGVKALAEAAILWWPSLVDDLGDDGGLDGRLIKMLLRYLAPEAVDEAERMSANLNHPTTEDLAWARASGSVS